MVQAALNPHRGAALARTGAPQNRSVLDNLQNFLSDAFKNIGQALFGPAASAAPAARTPVTAPRRGQAVRRAPQRSVRPQPRPAAPANPQGAAQGGTHTVRRGDNLSSIAKRHLGNANRWREIANLNNITDPRRLQIGTKLRLPNAGPNATPNATPNAAPNGAPHAPAPAQPRPQAPAPGTPNTPAPAATAPAAGPGTGNATVNQLNHALGGEFKGKGDAFMAAANKHGVDPKLLAAITMHETGNGTSNAVKKHNNPGGIMDPKSNWQKLKRFGSLEEGLDYTARNLKRGYIDKGLTTVEQIQKKYAPVGVKNDPNGLNKHWVGGVNRFLDKINQAPTNGAPAAATPAQTPARPTPQPTTPPANPAPNQTAGNGKVVNPATRGMTEAQKFDHYKNLIETHGQMKTGPNQRNLISLRNPTDADANQGRGRYDDVTAMIWTDANGKKHVREYTSNTDPIARYRGRVGVDANGDGKKDQARLPEGFYEYRLGSSQRLGNVLRPLKSVNAERDTNHDGLFNDNAYASAGQSILIHRGSNSHVSSAGCQTMPPAEFQRFWDDLKSAGNPGTVGYTLINQ